MSGDVQSDGSVARRRRNAVALKIALVLLPFLAWLTWGAWIVVLHVLADTRREACRDNVRALTRAMDDYLADNDQTYPPADRWCDALLPYLPDRAAFICPSARNRQCGYAFSQALSGRKTDTIADPRWTIMLFESDRGWNAAGGPELLPEEARHITGDTYGFADAETTRFIFRKMVAIGEKSRPIWAREPNDDEVRWEP